MMSTPVYISPSLPVKPTSAPKPSAIRHTPDGTVHRTVVQAHQTAQRGTPERDSDAVTFSVAGIDRVRGIKFSVP
ncbi:hypothetical protein GCM10023178_18880 [Actinomadura luteofluorescens]